MIVITRESTGLRLMFLISSNSFEDRENEIVRQKALEKYVKSFDNSGNLMFWHGGEPIGEIIRAEIKESFLVEVARELPDKIIDLGKDKPFMVSRKKVWDLIEKTPGDWGASIGFRHLETGKQGDTYNDIEKFETSVLPVTIAANAVTLAHIPKE
jgi:hypothetical protein